MSTWHWFLRQRNLLMKWQIVWKFVTLLLMKSVTRDLTFVMFVQDGPKIIKMLHKHTWTPAIVITATKMTPFWVESSVATKRGSDITDQRVKWVNGTVWYGNIYNYPPANVQNPTVIRNSVVNWVLWGSQCLLVALSAIRLNNKQL